MQVTPIALVQSCLEAGVFTLDDALLLRSTREHANYGAAIETLERAIAFSLVQNQAGVPPS